MTEKEKMLAGLEYLADDDEELVRLRRECKQLCQQINRTPIENEAERNALLRRLLGATGEWFEILPDFWCDYGFNIKIGEHFFANHGLVILDPAPVTFGDNVLIGPQCGFHTALHPTDAARRRMGIETAEPITVGSDVWFGAGVQVMPGVTIGSRTVIGGGSVVVKDIPDDCVAVGNPCRVVRMLEGERL